MLGGMRSLLLLAPALTLPALAQEGAAEERGLRHRADGAFEGYTLYTPLRETTTYLVDMEGRVVHAWEHELRPGNTCYLLEDGSLLRAARVPDAPRFHGGGQGGRIERLTWEGEVEWSFTLADEEALHHHDFEPLPDGNLLLIAWEWKSPEEAVAAGRDPEAVTDVGLWPDQVLEVRPVGDSGGEVVWEWHAWDHVIQDLDPEAENHGDVTAHPERIDLNADHRAEPPLSEAERERRAEEEARMRALGYVGGDEDDEPEQDPRDRRGRGRRPSGDWLHTNGIDHDPERDLIALSVHRLSEIWVIDHSTTTEEARGRTGGRYGVGGDLVWRFGNPRTYGAGRGRDRVLYSQHDARFVPRGWPGEGNLTVYNNGRRRPGGEYSTVEEVELVLDEAGRAVRSERGILEPLRPTWSYGHDEDQRFFSSFISGAERLPNGNTLVTSGAEGRVFEVTRAGEVVWDYLVPFGPDSEPDRGRPDGMVRSGLHRAGRVPVDHPGLAGRDLTPIETQGDDGRRTRVAPGRE